MKNILCIALLITCCMPTPVQPISKPAIAIAATGISLASLYGFYRFVSKPDFYAPTIASMNTLTFRPAENITEAPIMHIDDLVERVHAQKTPEKTNLIINNKPYTVYRGVEILPDDATVFIYSRGYARTNILGENDNFIQHGAGAKVGHILINDKLVNNAPLVTFDYPDDRRRFNFAQALDIECLTKVYNTVTEKNKTADIVLIGDCRGAKVAFEVASQKPPQLKALITLSPFICAKDLTNKIADSYLKYMPMSQEILCSFFQCYFPSYDPSKDDLIHRLADIDQKVPIYVGHRKFDTLIANETIELLIKKFQESGHSISVTIVDDVTEPHSKLTPNEEIQRSVNLFMKKHGLPHDPSLISTQQLKKNDRKKQYRRSNPQ